MVFYEGGIVKLYNSDCRCMAELPDGCIQCVVTSPPYWGLRKYAGLPDLIWGGKEDCQHEWGAIKKTIKHHSGETNPGLEAHFKDAGANDDTGSCFCSLCGAWKGQLGLEPIPEMYIVHLVEIFHEVRRVLRKDGVCFVNIGDSYHGGHRKSNPMNMKQKGSVMEYTPSRDLDHNSIKPKDLCLIPFRLAIALQEDGWWVRSVIIWNKPNPMPESVTDRPTESHEYILMLTKSARYYWDMEAVRSPLAEATIKRAESPFYPDHWKAKLYRETQGIERDAQTFNQDVYARIASGKKTGRNLRSVWTFSTQSFSGAHFATYPEELVRRCVLAATPEVGCCSKCGKPWVRVLDREDKRHWTKRNDYTRGKKGLLGTHPGGRNDGEANFQPPVFTNLVWQPQCKCNADKVPSIVLDPFAGSGTTLAVAKRLGRRGVGYELSKQYCALAIKRIEKETTPLI